MVLVTFLLRPTSAQSTKASPLIQVCALILFYIFGSQMETRAEPPRSMPLSVWDYRLEDQHVDHRVTVSCASLQLL